MSVEIKEQLEVGLKALRDLVDKKTGKQNSELEMKIKTATEDLEVKYLELEASNKANTQRVKDLEEQIYKSAKVEGGGANGLELKSFNTTRSAVASQGPVMDTESFGHYKVGMQKWLRKGLKAEFFATHLESLEQKAIQESVDSQGGYLVPPDFQNKLESALFDTSPMRQLAGIEDIGGDRWQQPFDTTGFGVQTTQEAAAVALTSTPSIAIVEIPVFSRVAKPMLTANMMADAVYDMEKYIRTNAARYISRSENTDFVVGDGVGRPKGFLSYPNGTAFGQIEKFSTSIANTLAWVDLITLQGNLVSGYRSNSSYVMSRSAWFGLLTEQTTTGEFKFSFGANGVGINAGAVPFSFLGRPVVLFEDMPVVATGSSAVALADWEQAYKVVNRSGVTILPDPYTRDGVVIFRITKRTGGGVYNSEAIKLLSIL